MAVNTVNLNEIHISTVELEAGREKRDIDYGTVMEGRKVRDIEIRHASFIQCVNCVPIILKLVIYAWLFSSPQRFEITAVVIGILFFELMLKFVLEIDREKIRKVLGHHIDDSYLFLKRSFVVLILWGIFEPMLIVVITFEFKSKGYIDTGTLTLFSFLIVPSIAFLIFNQICFRYWKISLWNAYIILKVEHGIRMTEAEMVPLKMLPDIFSWKRNRVKIADIEEQSDRY